MSIILHLFLSPTNVFSKEFTIDVADGSKRYQKRWYNNMREGDDENITSCKKKGYTFVTWMVRWEITVVYIIKLCVVGNN